MVHVQIKRYLYLSQFLSCITELLIGNDDGNGKENVFKIDTDPIVTIFDCPISFAFYIVGKVLYKWIGVRDLKLNTEK